MFEDFFTPKYTDVEILTFNVEYLDEERKQMLKKIEDLERMSKKVEELERKFKKNNNLEELTLDELVDRIKRIATSKNLVVKVDISEGINEKDSAEEEGKK